MYICESFHQTCLYIFTLYLQHIRYYYNVLLIRIQVDVKSDSCYWAIQAGLLTPLTFARHRLSPLAVLLPVRTFFTMEGSDSEFANFILPTLKAFFEARSHNVWK